MKTSCSAYLGKQTIEEAKEKNKLVNSKERKINLRSVTCLTCYICKLYVQGKENNEMPFINAHNEKWLTCPHCDIYFTRYDTKTRHIKKYCKKYVDKIQQLEKGNNTVERAKTKEIIPEETKYPYVEGNKDDTAFHSNTEKETATKCKKCGYISDSVGFLVYINYLIMFMDHNYFRNFPRN